MPLMQHMFSSKSIYAAVICFQGFLWILDPEKLPKATNERSSAGGPKEAKDKKNTVEVFPAKKMAMVKGHSLILSSPDGSQTTIQLVNCTALAVSASSMPSRKWLVQSKYLNLDVPY
jgi:hypothetical protein